MVLRVVVAPSPQVAAARAARHIATALRDAIAARGAATLALSGGSSAAALCAALAQESLEWSAVDVFQVDERVAPPGSSGRNLAIIERDLAGNGPPPFRLHAMPVEAADLEAAAGGYQRELAGVAGDPPALDIVHLGLGADGHTASLFPGDPATASAERSVAITGDHAGFRRMTLTLPALNGAQQVVWLVTGAAKAAVLGDLIAGRLTAPAGQVARTRAAAFVDEAAAGG